MAHSRGYCCAARLVNQPDNEEIGDLCNAQQGMSAGFTVQKEWSNAANTCVDH